MARGSNKNTLIVLLVVLVLFLLSTIYFSYQYYSLKNESDKFTTFGTSKIELPVDNDWEAILIASTSDEVKAYKEANLGWAIKTAFFSSASVDSIKKKTLEETPHFKDVKNTAYQVKYFKYQTDLLNQAMLYVYIDTDSGRIVYSTDSSPLYGEL